MPSVCQTSHAHSTTTLCWSLVLQQVTSDISRLPPQLLARVLQHVSPQERLQACAVVSTAWHAAAVMATSQVVFKDCTEKRCKSLSRWLHSNAALAAVSTIDLGSGSAFNIFGQQPRPQLLLPLQQLQDLRQLSCTGLLLAPAERSSTPDLTAAGPAAHGDQEDSDNPTLTPVLTPALSALTRLQLLTCRVKLDGLQHLTALQHLQYTPPSKVMI